jgi:hypothetical protein
LVALAVHEATTVAVTLKVVVAVPALAAAAASEPATKVADKILYIKRSSENFAIHFE